MPKQDNTVLMEGVRIIFRNFTGRETKYNREGDRNFTVLLDERVAKEMERDGWNIRYLEAREEGDTPQAIISVSIGFNNKSRPPRIVMITSRGRTNLTEDECEILDWADIINVDLIIRPYEWAVGGKSGIKAYLQALYVTIQEDPLEMKYSDIMSIPTRSGRVDE